MQFWTSRGFAVLDVDYRGSTGYGTAFRRELRDAWGICDLDDVCAGAEHLVAQGIVDSGKLAIDGGSAGGYTTLGALAFRDVFSAGCSLYGVADLGGLAADTHKFECRYLDRLVGRWPEDKAVYDARAPINSCDTLSCPVLLLQASCCRCLIAHPPGWLVGWLVGWLAFDRSVGRSVGLSVGHSRRRVRALTVWQYVRVVRVCKVKAEAM